MLDQAAFERIVTEANLAPSVHNAQPARWRLRKDVIDIGADRQISLPQVDPDGAAIGLSCGAAIEATVLACQSRGYRYKVIDQWGHEDFHTWPGHRLAAQIYLAEKGKPDALFDQLSQRFTWRSSFENEAPRLFGWSRSDTTLVLDAPTREWLADLNDTASLEILNRRPFRKELLAWMRLDPAHQRWDFDGLSAEVLQMPRDVARKLRFGFGPAWPLLRMFGATKHMTAEKEMTLSAPVLAAFHVPRDTTDTDAGRAYLRLWLEATRLGFAGWPMSALTDHAPTRAQVAQRLNVTDDMRLVQILRFGKPRGKPPARARRPLKEICDDR